MRFLGIGDTCDLGALYALLQKDGHEVRVYVNEPLSHGTFAGIIDRTADWRAELPWVAEAGDEGIILFENVAAERGKLQDQLRASGFGVIGGSAFGDRLENDRGFAQRVLNSIGLQTARVNEFSDFEAAASFIDQYPARYVLKFNGGEFSSSDNYVGWSPQGIDTKAVLKAKRGKATGIRVSFILMEHVDGIEMGVGGYFNGERFIGPPCLDWEHKRFFTHDMGELTGEMGTVATFERSQSFFEMTLGKMEDLLRRHGYCGYINLNTIVNESGIWPLEFTCRFGYPGYAVLTPLQRTDWAALFKAMISRAGEYEVNPGFCVGLVLTTPPFPYNRKILDESVGAPVFIEEVPEQLLASIHYGEVGFCGGQLVTSGIYGWTMVVTGTGESVQVARDDAIELARRVHIPNLRYRTDIGDKLISRDFSAIEQLGFLDPRP